MSKEKMLIIGGVAGGATAAARLRRRSEEAEITIIEKGPAISFANCGLPYYVGGAIKHREALFLQSPEGMKSRFNVDVLVNHAAASVDTDARIVVARDLKTGENRVLSYDKLLLAPGAQPVKPAFAGTENEGFFTLWSVEDADRVYGYLQGSSPKQAIIVGGGFIGVEMAENLAARGLAVTVVEAADHVLPSLDFDMAAFVQQQMEKNGVLVRPCRKTVGLEPLYPGLRVLLDNGEALTADIVLWCAGVRPNTGFLQGANIAVSARGGILVNEYLETSAPGVYAAGDAAHLNGGAQPRWPKIPLAGPANKQGRIAADNMLGGKVAYIPGPGAQVAKVFGIAAAAVGSTESMLSAADTPYLISVIFPPSHAAYYPGASSLCLKLLYSRQGEILGAQAVGAEGADKRIDVIAAAMALNAKVADLTRLDLCYAPPFSSAKDPVNMAGYVAENVLNGLVRTATWRDLMTTDSSHTLILDVRDEPEWRAGHIPGALLIPLNELRGRLAELPRDKEIIVHCGVGQRSYAACRILMANGFDKVRNLTGGYRFFAAAAGAYIRLPKA